MLYCSEAGGPEGNPVFFLHGGSFTGRSWHAIADRLVEMHCLLPDLPGHGESQHHTLASLEQAADDLAALIIEKCGDRKVDIVGLSLGGYVGFMMMARHPNVVGRAMLSGIQIGSIPKPRAMILMMNVMSPLFALKWFRQKMAKSMGITDMNLVNRNDGSANVSPATLRTIGRLAAKFEVQGLLETIDIPTLIIAGGREHPSILNSLQVYQTGMPNCTARIAPDMGHGWCIEDPDLFAETVRAWMTEAPLPIVLKDLDNHAD